MNEKEKRCLLIRTINEMSSYGLKCQINNDISNTPRDLVYIKEDLQYGLFTFEYKGEEGAERIEASLSDVRPYLRPISSMTPEEYKEMGKAIQENYISPCGEMKPGESPLTVCVINQANNLLNWLRKKHFDYLNLIDKGLALEASEGMYV